MMTKLDGPSDDGEASSSSGLTPSGSSDTTNDTTAPFFSFKDCIPASSPTKPAAKTPKKPGRRGARKTDVFDDFSASLSYRELFMQRMKHEDKLALFDARVAQKIESGIHREKAIAETAVEFGRRSRVDERRMYACRLREKAEAERRAKRASLASSAREKRKFDTYEQAIATLPDTANDKVELDWIRAHPAMARRSRSKGNQRILLTAEDIAFPPHGAAPSKSAAHALQHWCNRPEEFFKSMISEQKKESASARARTKPVGNEAIEDDTSGIDQMLGL